MPPRPALVVAAVLVAGCATAGAGAPVTSAAFTPAPADSCARAQYRAEQQPVFRVMREAIADRGNMPPAYPLREQQTRFRQQVTVRFLVTPAGVVDTTTVDVIATSGPSFAREVLLVLPTWRFTPAELVPGCRVRFRVTMPITFHEPTARSAS
jgi:TonB family protein